MTSTTFAVSSKAEASNSEDSSSLRAEDELGTELQITLDEISSINDAKDFDAVGYGGLCALAAAINSDLSSGLSSRHSGRGSVDSQRALFGSNVPHQVAGRSFWRLLCSNLKDPIILLLIAAATVSRAVQYMH